MEKKRLKKKFSVPCTRTKGFWTAEDVKAYININWKHQQGLKTGCQGVATTGRSRDLAIGLQEADMLPNYENGLLLFLNAVSRHVIA